MAIDLFALISVRQAIALANKMTGQMAVNTINPKATSSDE